MKRILVCALVSAAFAADRYDTASVKPNTGLDSRLRMQFLPGGKFQATAASLASLVRHAYGVRDVQVGGAQEWMKSEHFDITAAAEGLPAEVPLQQSQRMLQALLAERFQLRIRRDSKEMPVYALVVSRNGAKLENSERPKAPGLVMTRATSIDALCSLLTTHAGRMVVNHTGITEEREIRLVFAPERLNGQPPPPEVADLTIFAAVEQQLGLKLEPRRAPVDFIIIESAQRPTAN